MAWGRRCPAGCESWPDHKEYVTCPACDLPTKRFRNLTILDEEEARSKKLHFEFEDYCRERDSVPS